MEDTIAEISLVGQRDAEPEFSIQVAVSKPHFRDGDWICLVSLTGLDSQPRSIYGTDSLQASTLALKHIVSHISKFVAAGGQLLDAEERQPFPLSAYFPS